MLNYPRPGLSSLKSRLAGTMSSPIMDDVSAAGSHKELWPVERVHVELRKRITHGLLKDYASCDRLGMYTWNYEFITRTSILVLVYFHFFALNQEKFPL